MSDQTVVLPDWSLVLSTYGRAEMLRSCLQAAIAQTYPPDEVIVVDASPDWADSRDRAMTEIAPRAPNLRWQYVQAERTSLPAQRNQGIALARSPILFMIDDDSIMYPDCAEEILKVYAADTRHKVAAIGACEVWAMPELADSISAINHSAQSAIRAASTSASTQPSPGWRRRLASWYDRGEASFLPYDGSWPDRQVPPECTLFDVSPVRTINGFRMSFRRDVIAAEKFSDWFASYAPLEDLDATYRVSRRGVLLAAHRAKLRHLSTPTARIKQFSVAAQWVMSSAALHVVYGRNPAELSTNWRRRVRRAIPLELIKDLAKLRLQLPNFRGVLYGYRQLERIYNMSPTQVMEWYPREQVRLNAISQRR